MVKADPCALRMGLAFRTEKWRIPEHVGATMASERSLNGSLGRGSRVHVEGQLQTRKWTDDEGTERLITMVVLGRQRSELVPLDPKTA